MQTLEIGQDIATANNLPSQWWGKESNFKYGKKQPLILTGKITKICKNKNIHFACNEMKNISKDGLTTSVTTEANLLTTWDEIS